MNGPQLSKFLSAHNREELIAPSGRYAVFLEHILSILRQAMKVAPPF
jgi:hypothetical protein